MYIGIHVMPNMVNKTPRNFSVKHILPPYNKYAKNIRKQTSVTIVYNQEVILQSELGRS